MPSIRHARGASTRQTRQPRPRCPAGVGGHPNGGRPERYGRTFGYADSQLPRANPSEPRADESSRASSVLVEVGELELAASPFEVDYLG